VVDGFFSRFGCRLALLFGLGVLGYGCRGPAHPPGATQLVLTLRDYDTSRYRDLSGAIHEVPGVYDMTIDAADMRVAVFVEPKVTSQDLRTAAANRNFHLEEGGGHGSYVTPAGWSQGSDIIFLNAAGEDFPNLPLSTTRYTVVEFTAQWCPGCHMLSNEIKRLLIARKDIAFRVVDIGNFGSPAHEHWCSTLNVLPYVLVYTPEGEILAEHPGFKRGWVEKTIDEHARSVKGARASR
jgi:thiol-disulfide isomerase/thioredoxin